LSSAIRVRIAENSDFSPEVLRMLRAVAHVDVAPCTPEQLPEIFDTYDVFWFRLGFQLDRGLLSAANRLSVIATPVTGIDHIDETTCAEKNIRILCLRGAYDFLREVRATAEHTLALTLALLRQLPAAAAHAANGHWKRDLFRGHELYKKKVGIIGYGRLGEITASYFNAFGCEVLYYDILPKTSHFAIAVKCLDDIAHSDIISVHVNYTPATHHLIGRDFFRACRPHSIFINTSRGDIVDELALLEALKSKQIRGAALDVVHDEHNYSPTNELACYGRKYHNLILTPHIGGNTYESFEKTEYYLAQQLINHLDTVSHQACCHEQTQ
jgi:D-3-phosphoglycerate dehydrogenase